MSLERSGDGQPPPGWYLDTIDRSMWRWWTGHEWTSDTAPLRALSWVELRPSRRWIALGVLLIASAVDYASWLGAHDHNYVNAQGQYRGPYEVWQVIGFVSVIVALLLVAGWQRLTLDAATSVAVAVAVTFACYGTRQPGPDDGWRATLTIFIAGGTFSAGVAITRLSAWLRDWRPDLLP